MIFELKKFGLCYLYLKLFKGKKNGFFIEAGAYDGEMWSNSLFYEVEKGWNGLLVEAHPEAFGKMKKRVRNTYLNPELATPLIVRTYVTLHNSRIESQIRGILLEFVTVVMKVSCLQWFLVWH